MTKKKEEAKEIIVKEAFYEVARTRVGEEEEVEMGRIRVSPFETNPAVVSVKGGATVNLGNYQSARVDVMLSIPCYVEEIDEIYPKAKEWVDSRLAKEYKELKEASQD